MLICEFDDSEIENLSNQKLEFTVFLNIDYIHSNLIVQISKNIAQRLYNYDEAALMTDESLIKKFIKLNIDDLIIIIKNVEEVEIY